MATNLHRRDDDGLAAITPPTAATALLHATEIGLIYFDDARETVALGPDHRAAELLQHGPRAYEEAVMRRVVVFLSAVIALVAMAGAVSAQSRVTITGFVDNISSWSSNMSVADINPGRTADSEWYARTRIQPNITAEVGTTKFVLGLEIDAAWGQTGSADSTLSGGAPQRAGSTGGWDLNTDLLGTIELKWAYTEFNVPLIPIPTRMRLGAQPWQATYKLAVLATGDFAGVHTTMQLTPTVRLNLSVAQIEEASTGPTDNFIRGDDFAFVGSVETTPFKGLFIRPIVSYANFVGPTSGASRQARGGVGTGAANFPTCPGTAGPGTGNCPSGINSSANEHRFTVGVDARWRFGPFSLEPTVMYQFGRRDQTVAEVVPLGNGTSRTLDRSAWLVDIRGGWQAGPLLIEAAGIYTTGNQAKDRIDRNDNSTIKFYEPISADVSFYGAGWAEIWALGIDYFNALRLGAPGLFPGVAIGYDKYGLIRVGARASYAPTPYLTLRAAANANWTAEPVDSNSTLIAATGLTPCAGLTGAVGANCDAAVHAKNGESQYLGTEINLGFQWRFAPNVAFDMVGAYMFAGNALATHQTVHPLTGIATSGRDPQDVKSVVARVRYIW